MTAEIGHNSAVAGEELRQFVERVERLEAEKAGIAGDIRDVKVEAKGRGFDVKAINAIVKARKQDPSERAEHEAIVETYRNALGL